MKTRKLSFAIIAIAIITISVTIMSCKKDNENSLHVQNEATSQSFDYRQIKDKLTYLTDFKNRMTENKSNETYSLEDAAWHLACLANLDFCNVNVNYNDFRFDTIVMKVNVKDGSMLLSDLNTAYNQACLEIQRFKNSFNLVDQNMYYINMSIGADGIANIAVMTSYNSYAKDIIDHTWYFEDPFDAYYSCEEHFTDDSTYFWNTTAAQELERILNLYEHHENITNPFISLICYIPTRNHTFDYTNTYDPYGTDYNYFNDSRVFAKRYTQPISTYILDFLEMCYCLDSYLGLGYDYIDDNLYADEQPVSWTVRSYTYEYHNPPITNYYYYYHQLYVEYGQLISPNPHPSE